MSPEQRQPCQLTERNPQQHAPRPVRAAQEDLDAHARDEDRAGRGPPLGRLRGQPAQGWRRARRQEESQKEEDVDDILNGVGRGCDSVAIEKHKQQSGASYAGYALLKIDSEFGENRW